MPPDASTPNPPKIKTEATKTPAQRSLLRRPAGRMSTSV